MTIFSFKCIYYIYYDNSIKIYNVHLNLKFNKLFKFLVNSIIYLVGIDLSINDNEKTLFKKYKIEVFCPVKIDFQHYSPPHYFGAYNLQSNNKCKIYVINFYNTALKFFFFNEITIFFKEVYKIFWFNFLIYKILLGKFC